MNTAQDKEKPQGVWSLKGLLRPNRHLETLWRLHREPGGEPGQLPAEGQGSPRAAVLKGILLSSQLWAHP